MSDAKVLFDYDAEADDELSLKEGDLIRNIEKKEDGWWEGELNGRRGMFPENFVEEIKKPAPSVKAAREPVAPSEKAAVAKVTFDYDAENVDELSLREGEIIKVLKQEEEGWWKGELNGKIGVFPANFVELVKGAVPTESQPALDTSHQESDGEKEPPGKKTPKAIGGIGFGGILTQDALSGIKLRKSNSGSKIDAKKETPDDSSELSKKLSNKRNPPKIPENEVVSVTRPPKLREKAIVEYDYEGEQSDELSLQKGDIITIVEKDVSEGWWKGELKGKIGLFPDNFVKLLSPEELKKEIGNTKDQGPPDIPLPKKPPMNDTTDGRPSRPEPPLPKLKPPQDPKPKPPEEIPKRPEPPPSESKPGLEERPPKLLEKPSHRKAVPVLPKKPDKPKPAAELPSPAKDSPPLPNKPLVELRHRNGPNADPSKRFSEIPHGGSPAETRPKRHSSGSDVPLNLNDIKSAGVLQPLTSDRPKNPAKNPPTKYGRPHSPKKISTPEKEEVDGPKEPKEVIRPLEKPKKPAIPTGSKPAIPEGVKPKSDELTVNSSAVKKLQDEINALKNSLASISKEFKEHVKKSEKRFEGMEKKLTDEIDDLTKELDEEKKARAAVDVEVNRLRKLIKNQLSS